MWSISNLSNNLPTTDVKLTVNDILLDRFLNNVVMFATIHSVGTVHSS